MWWCPSDLSARVRAATRCVTASPTVPTPLLPTQARPTVGPRTWRLVSPKNPLGAVKADLNVLMAAQAETGIPLLIGSCGQAGGDAGVAWTRDIAVEVAAELGLTPRIAVLYSEQDTDVLKRKN